MNAPLSHRLRKALGIQEGEWPRFKLFAAAFFMVSVGVEFGRIGRDSYFLKEAGVSAIPLMYVFIAVLMVTVAPLYDRFSERMVPYQLMVVMQVGGGVGILLLWAGTTLLPHPPHWLPFLVFPAIEAYLLFLLMHFWTCANKGFDAWEGRRVFPYVVGTGLLGALIAGLVSRVISSTLGAPALLVGWALLLFGTIPLTRKMRTASRVSRQTATLDAEDMRASGVFEAEPTLGQVWRQPLLRTLAYMALPMWIIIYTIEYSYFDAANRMFVDQDALAGFLGLVISLGAATGLILQFSFTPWALRKLGVGTASMVYPSTLTLGAVALLFFSLFPESQAQHLPLFGVAMLAIFARWCDVAFFFSVHDAAQQLLLYAVPSGLRGKARVMMHAMIIPASIAAAGGLLIAFRRTSEPTHNIAFVAVTLSFLLMVLGLSVAPEYLRSLLANIRPDATAHREQVLQEIAKLPTNDARYVLMQSLTSHDLTEARFAVERLFAIKDPDLIDDMLESASKMSPEVLQVIESHMTPDERHVHANVLRGSLMIHTA